MRELVKLHVMHLMSISFVDQFAAGTVSVPKNANFSPKALTKERSKTSLNYGKYLVCGLNVEPIFKGFLLCLERDCWARWTQTTIRNIASIKYDRKRVRESSSKRCDVIKLKSDEHSKQQRKNSSAVQHSCLEQLWNTFQHLNPDFRRGLTVDLDFDCCIMGSFKRSSCVGERLRASLNQLWN